MKPCTLPRCHLHPSIDGNKEFDSICDEHQADRYYTNGRFIPEELVNRVIEFLDEEICASENAKLHESPYSDFDEAKSILEALTK